MAIFLTPDATASVYRIFSMNVTLLISFKGGHSQPHLVEGRLAQEAHAFFAGGAADFRGRLLGQNHLADAVAQVEQFVDRGPAAEPGAGALDPPWPS